ncbi:MAG: hypothetical protein B1H07_02210 [Campylobacteraceae bacterium 4484_166]|nr:MAG: hypothetical protein B1H07_02210 [Campylobacteraceae bacterium 4484_166]
MIRLNCDIGEGFGIYELNNDEKIYPHIDMANIACGFHAGDANTMQKSVKMALDNFVQIGAHISYQDLIGFGRRHMSYTNKELEQISLYQIGALSAFCLTNNTNISYIKPHGAMYNDMMNDENIFKTLLQTIQKYDNKLKLMVLSRSNNTRYENIAKRFNTELIFEVFVDRNYTDDGFLLPRSNKDAVIQDKKELIQRVQTLKQYGYISSINQKKLYLQTDSLCIHSDNTQAVKELKLLKDILR